ncbi:hypothetical protein PpBr36_07109 [Pyricularia pennisetigena]|uniref:hypothetical protein n=1 Tax=Pyricularia pennisetigena TaxID=1578925 RepID=UPI00114EADF7|nr:hypothetical protein PpBr36_07109 [Pyricularia pennisetigena]TLS26087.1 hypothetical protein PpBr36_07109 [Pyricularia pennisetigena]
MASKKKKSQKQKTATAAGTGKSIQKRKKAVSRRNDRWASASAPLPSLVVRRPAPVISSKHTTYFEIVENTEKKKKLEFQVTTDRTPPPGFEFVPIGNPDLTKACKELSREQDAMIFIVSAMDHGDGSQLGLHMNRVGHHIRRTIVEQARTSLGQSLEYFLETASDKRPEPIPETQEEINAQADAALRDLFPRMPNTDRQMVIDRSFRKGGGETVGLAADLTLSRRVQLAVLAHIRHTHTTYDELWRTHGWATARKAIEATCLDFIVKWRGDEETGRDQLDEILREVIVISDSEGSEDEDDEDDDDTEDDSSETEDSDQTEAGEIDGGMPSPRAQAPYRTAPYRPGYVAGGQRDQFQPPRIPASSGPTFHRRLNSTNFRRYEAVAQTRWEQAQNRVRHENVPTTYPAPSAPLHRVDNRSDLQPYQPYNPRSQQPGPPSRDHNRPGLLPAEVLSGTSRPVDPRVSISTAVKGLELKDYLVPSIEPRSPENLTSPIFVRTLPPRVHERQSARTSLRRRSRSPVYRSPQPSAAFDRTEERGYINPDPNATSKYRIDGGGLSSRHVGSSDVIGMAELSQGSYLVLPDDRRKYADMHSHQPYHTTGSRQPAEPQPWPPQRVTAPTVGVGSQRHYPDHLETVLLGTERRPILIEDWERRTVEQPLSAGSGGWPVLADDGRSAIRPVFAPPRPFPPDTLYTPTMRERGLVQPDIAGLPVVDHNDPRAAAYPRRLLSSGEVYSQPHEREFPPNREQLPMQPRGVVIRPPSPQYRIRPEDAPGRRHHILGEEMPSMRFNDVRPATDGVGEPRRIRVAPPASLMHAEHTSRERQYLNDTEHRPSPFAPRVEYIHLD